jgi:hypothetical protein
LEIHHTPKHGSWLNMAETELSILSRQCLDRRIDCKAISNSRSAKKLAKTGGVVGTFS